MYPGLFHSTPFFIAAFSILSIALFALPRRKARSAGYLIALSLAGAYWAASEGLLYCGWDIEVTILITHLQYLGITTLIPLTLLFTLSFFGYEDWINRTSGLLLAAFAVAINLLVWTNPWHHMVFADYFVTDSGAIPMLGLDHGPLWWAIIGYHYLLAALTSLILTLKFFRSSGIRRSQAGVILIAVVILWMANAVYVIGRSPVPNMDLGPLAFILVALSMAWGFFRYNLLDILPIAKGEIFMALSDPILVLDEKNRVLDLNPSAEGLFAIPRMESIGCDIGDLIDHHAQWIDCSPAVQTREINLPVDGAERCFDVRVSGLKGVNGTMAGRMFVFHDISERKKADLALWESERLQGVLEMAGAVCSDLSKPIRAISACSDKLIEGVDGDEVLYPKTLKLNEQTKRIEEIIQRLTRITRYETRNYLGRKIVDLEKSSIEEAQP